MGEKKVLFIFGTRPEAIKMAPLVKELEKTPGYQAVVCVSAQHRELLDQVLSFFEIEVQIDLNIMKEGQTLFGLSSGLLEQLEGVFRKERYDLVLVHGDTTTAFMGALAAYYARIPVGHVEAGLRTYDKYAPFPEEINRECIGRMADLHFAPTRLAADRLCAENRTTNVFVTGNTGIDAMKWTLNAPFNHPIKEKLRQDSRWILMTMHRRENWGEPMKRVFEAVRKMVLKHPDLEFIYPVHPNPRIRDVANRCLKGCERVHLIEPLEVVDLHHLMNKSYLILTDSGGIQEEAPSLGKPVLVLRDNTERPEGLAAGTLRCIGTDTDSVIREMENLMQDTEAYRQMAEAENPFGDGNASRRIVDAVRKYFGS